MPRPVRTPIMLISCECSLSGPKGETRVLRQKLIATERFGGLDASVLPCGLPALTRPMELCSKYDLWIELELVAMLATSTYLLKRGEQCATCAMDDEAR